MIPFGFDIKVNEKTLIIAAVLVIGAVWYTRKEVTAAAVAVAGAVNPLSPDNMFNQAVTNTGAVITGDPGWTLGGALYDLGHNTGTNKPNIIGDIFDTITGVK